MGIGLILEAIRLWSGWGRISGALWSAAKWIFARPERIALAAVLALACWQHFHITGLNRDVTRLDKARQQWRYAFGAEKKAFGIVQGALARQNAAVDALGAAGAQKQAEAAKALAGAEQRSAARDKLSGAIAAAPMPKDCQTPPEVMKIGEAS